jgi:hypothetical protein
LFLIYHYICSIVENNIEELYFESLTEEERHYRNNTSHDFKGRSIENTSFFVLAFAEIRVEWPHLLFRFSLLLGFLGYILCLFVDGV